MKKISLEKNNNSNSDALINNLRKSFQDFSGKKNLNSLNQKKKKKNMLI